MKDFENTIKEEANRILDQYRDTLKESPAKLYKDLSEARKKTFINQIYSYIKTTVDYLETRNDLQIELKSLMDFKWHFYTAFNQLKEYLKNNWEKSYSSFLKNRDWLLGNLNRLLLLSLWDDDFADDPNGDLSPFGPLLIAFRRYKRKRRVGILHAAEQQLAHTYADNLGKAQRLAKEIHYHFMDFASSNMLGDLKRCYEYPPVVQFCAGGAAALFVGLPVPTFIAMDKTKADEFSKFSALPHECGHNLAGQFKNSGLVTEIKEAVKTLRNPRVHLWQKWIEECLADAIGVAIIKEGEIFSLANLFADNYTNRIYKDNRTGEVDEHPIRHIRVLLTIEVCRKLGIDKTILKDTKEQWNDFEEKTNTNKPRGEIEDLCSKKAYKMKDFVGDIEGIAELLVETEYKQLKGKTVMDIFADFESNLADEMRTSINETEKKWI